MKSIKDSITAEQAIQWLADNGVINTPEYWLSALKHVKYLDMLLIKIVRKFSFC